MSIVLVESIDQVLPEALPEALPDLAAAAA
jgi:hypothetical protein